MSHMRNIPNVTAELFAKFQISFYNSPEDAVIKAVGIEWLIDLRDNIKRYL